MQAQHLSREDRIFRLGEDLYAIYTGNLEGEDKPFIRLGPAPLDGLDLNVLFSHFVLPQKVGGNLGREKLVASLIERLGEHEFFSLKPEQTSIRYVADKNYLKKLYRLLMFKPGDEIHIPEKYGDIDAASEDGYEVESQYFTDGNIKINLKNRNIFDLERTNRTSMGLRKIWEQLEKGCDTSPNCVFGEVITPQETGFIFPLPRKANYRFWNEENYRWFDKKEAAISQNRTLLFNLRDSLVAVNPDEQEHWRIARYGLNLAGYNTVISSEIQNQGLYQLMTYANICGEELESSGQDTPQINVRFPDEESEGALKAIYPHVRCDIMRSGRVIGRKNPIGYFNNTDGSLAMLEFNAGSQRRKVMFPLKEGNYLTRFEGAEGKPELLILPHNREGYGDTHPALALVIPEEHSYQVEGIKLSMQEKINDWQERLTERFDNPPEPPRGQYELIPDARYKFFDSAKKDEIQAFLTGIFGESSNIPLAVSSLVSSPGEENLLQFAALLINYRPVDVLEKANLAEIARLVYYLGSSLRSVEESTIKALKKLEKRFSHQSVYRLQDNYKTMQTRIKKQGPVYIPALKKKSAEELGLTFEDKVLSDQFEMNHSVWFIGHGAFLFHRLTRVHVRELPESFIGFDTDDKITYKRLHRAAEKYNENAEYPDKRLVSYLNTVSRVRELHQGIEADQRRLQKFLDRNNIHSKMNLFKWHPTNAVEEFFQKARRKIQEWNGVLTRNRFLESIQQKLELSFHRKLPFAFLSLILAALLTVGLIAAAGVVSSSSGKKTAAGDSKTLIESGEGDDSGLPMSDKTRDELLNSEELKSLLANGSWLKMNGNNASDNVHRRAILHEIYQYASKLSLLNGYGEPGKKVTADQKDPDIIHPGEKLSLPTGDKVKVVKKDTIWKISSREYARVAGLLLEYIDDEDNSSMNFEEANELAVTDGLKKLLALKVSEDQTN